ncbi:MAG: hypothetical protein IKQ27_16480 [Lachnospiraceae bacterium]|nr:hypothetical protein [Lachnospiraceae bacterium]MBR3735375.1 hypothetical protein [Lachnospiraceae bacterium]MBR6158550.1 hypothetical protein [Lachnospiraceae bacterium]
MSSLYEYGAPDQDFKYILQDLSKTMIGARFTYSELMEQERVPFKFQTIIDRLILPVMDEDMEIGAHILSLTKADKNYRIYENLKLKIRYYAPKKNGGFESKTVSLAELVKEAEHWDERSVLHEVILSNLALMSFKM